MLERTDAVATVTLNRPANGNRIDDEMALSIRDICAQIAEDDKLRLVVLTATGNVFSVNASVDDKSYGSRNALGNAGNAGNPGEQLAGLAIPVLVAMNGDATGPGLELALAGDLRICVATARFGFTGLTRGVLPQDGGTQRLPRLVGPAWAGDMLLTGRMVDATEALSIGLVNRVAPEPGGLMAAVEGLARAITGGSPVGVRYAKEAVGQGMDLTLDQGLRLEADLNVILQSTSDRAEGIKSFLEKRSPRFTGS
ncbi:MAG: enoyl-CoA hydratase/isomerase family protein [Chloroflexi bacterium]|nr:enoyl-CoA hydratase/isomerase family protein [Chloroflexota bacterium]